MISIVLVIGLIIYIGCGLCPILWNDTSSVITRIHPTTTRTPTSIHPTTTRTTTNRSTTKTATTLLPRLLLLLRDTFQQRMRMQVSTIFGFCTTSVFFSTFFRACLSEKGQLLIHTSRVCWMLWMQNRKGGGKGKKSGTGRGPRRLVQSPIGG